MKEADANEHCPNSQPPPCCFRAPPENRSREGSQLHHTADHHFSNAAALVFHGLHLAEVEEGDAEVSADLSA
ncbi:hypothetical protein D3C78_1912380 [compost metagenome]